MKKITYLLFVTFLLSFTGCENKETAQYEKSITTTLEGNSPVENTNKSSSNTSKKVKVFTLNDIDNKKYTIHFKEKRIKIENISQNLILVTFFATWCPPCKGQLPYLSDLGKKYKKNLFIAGILVNDANKKPAELKSFLKKYTIDYFISNSKENDLFTKELLKGLKIRNNFQLPLTVLYKNTKYYAHYEGAIPIEMIEYDLKNAMKNKE